MRQPCDLRVELQSCCVLLLSELQLPLFKVANILHPDLRAEVGKNIPLGVVNGGTQGFNSLM